ncbi:45651_t:CDS:1, partial [Gigaspora margarita]
TEEIMRKQTLYSTKFLEMSGFHSTDPNFCLHFQKLNLNQVQFLDTKIY